METRKMFFMQAGEEVGEYLKPIQGVDALVCFANEKEATAWGERSGMEPFKLIPVTMTYEGEAEEPEAECEHEWIAQIGGGVGGAAHSARCDKCNVVADMLPG